MKIKHTHPEYATPEERRQALLDVKRTCTAMLPAQKKTANGQTA